MRKTFLALTLAAAALPALSAEPLTVGTTVQGQLLASDRPSDRGGRSHDYSLRLSEGQLVAVTLKSSDFDPVVIVFKPDGDLLGENDDRDDGSTNSLLVVTAPETGVYTVRVNSLPMGEGHVGAYSLRASVISDD
ncbi:PPC domain-containing protein [Luteimonas sp. SDU101]|uniref:PPC domain-containing protein n=1 Tax=unclassified Luteimonas TaxID=2629088 RepID=UPI003EBF6902